MDDAEARAARRVVSRSASRSHRQYRAWRAAYMARHPLCEHCQREGYTVAAVELDHIVPLARGGALMDEGNVQALCVRHHLLKGRTDGSQDGADPERQRWADRLAAL